MNKKIYIVSFAAAALSLAACASSESSGSSSLPASVNSAAGSSETQLPASTDASPVSEPSPDVEFVLASGLVAPSNDLGYEYRSEELQLEKGATVAAALGVSVEPFVSPDNSYALFGPEDNTEPTVFVSNDLAASWFYQSEFIATEPPPPGSVDDPIVAAAEPLTDFQVLQLASDLATSLNIEFSADTVEIYADKFSATASIPVQLGEVSYGLGTTFSWDAEGDLLSASGLLVLPSSTGPYDLITLNEAFERLTTDPAFGFASDSVEVSSAAGLSEDLQGSDVLAADPVKITLTDVQPGLYWAGYSEPSVLLPAFDFFDVNGYRYSVPSVDADLVPSADFVEDPTP